MTAAAAALALALAAVLLNPAVGETVAGLPDGACRPGWTDRMRPRASYVAALERAMLPAGADPRNYVMDHIMPLALGGDPVSPSNLRPQLIAEAKRKDVLERALARAVCAGRLSLPEAQARMRAAWP